GELTRPVQEVTVAGNLLDMLSRLDGIGSDLTFRGSVGAPTIRFNELTVSGE
ncbi:MAG: TldD/PmbA family protein, partial [Archangium sp.]|nr:TldD/PmbA family protein [Archangium sp.]